jgi:bleomycin hydrolase
MADLLAKPTSGAVTLDDIKRYQNTFESDPALRAAMNAVCTTSVEKVALDRRTAAVLDNSFSLHLPENPATSQMKSGRCWMFAALNTFRGMAGRSLNVENGLELSQNYTMFWDKFEKANYFLENVLATLDEPIGSRLLDFLLAHPIQDGGQWHMFVNLIDKYGVVPKTVMPETESSSATGRMNDFITGKLREYACSLRKSAATGTAEKGLRSAKDEFMSEVYRMLCIHLGEPPASFEFQWRDKDKAFHRAGRSTPQEFYLKHVGLDLKEFVCLINDPRPEHEYDQVYTVRLLGNVVGGCEVEYLNVDITTMKKAAIAQIQAGEPVWFGCDVGKFLERDLGVMDEGLFDYGLVYGTTAGMTKAERLHYRDSLMTHAMVFTGVDVAEDGSSKKWRVENSWSDKVGDKGYFQMSDPWFNEFNFEVVVHKDHVSGDSLKAIGRKPIELDPWDPMGSLAL